MIGIGADGVNGGFETDPVFEALMATAGLCRENTPDELKALLDLDPLHPGSLSRQYNVCEKIACRCKDPAKPRRHGPYYQVSYVHLGHSTSRFVPLKRSRKSAPNWPITGA
jgi:hypothetical protein